MTKALIRHVSRFPRWHALGVASLSLILLLAGLWPTPSQSVVVEIPATLYIPQTEAAEQEAPALNRVSEEVRTGDTLSSVFERSGAGVSILYRMLADDTISKPLERIYPGQSFEFMFNDENRLAEVTFSESTLVKHRIDIVDDQFRIEKIELKPDIHTRYAEATIDSSLYMAGIEAGLSDNMIMQLATLFGWDVDFALEIRAGDRFSLIYEERYLDGEKLEDGPILVARFVNQGRDITALRYTDANGKTDYYSPNGDSMRKAFLRNPLDVFRISSRFNPNRRHPVLNTIRAHRGTDYAAPTGTPIRATGDGRVVLAGPNGGYGTSVVLQHGGNMRTLYAHMSRLASGVRNGSSVRQGQVIGYVGATGLATGPHLHYEFLVNGVHQNPETVPLPTADPLPREQLPAFTDYATNMLGQLEVFEATAVAME
ncbi:MAG: peptidoglycan DD-metalloendopeptidase family protein [Saccharospirillum sp.]